MAESNSGHFLLRAVALQLILLGLWWTVLYRASVGLLWLTAEVPLTLLLTSQSKDTLAVDASSGDWNFSIPVNALVKDSTQSDSPVSVEAIDFAAPVANVATFTTGWFVYLGLALSVPITRNSLRRTLKGLLFQTAISALAVFTYAEVNARGTLAHMHRTPDPVGLWFLSLVYHIDYLVIPYASPFLLILWTHAEWWSQLVGSRAGAGRKPG
ncbi:MAG TPA: hypothetical protein VN841_26440 [Bryobacteraceae bacterium]|nr:hypothetical protein [Bryobacteraceae bacterium]